LRDSTTRFARLSVTNARELAQTQIAREAEELEQTPLAEQHELALIFQAKGMMLSGSLSR
jgi:hypothetical protein